MNTYKNFDDDLKDCESTTKVITRVNSVITAMTSRSSENSLTPESTSYQVRTFHTFHIMHIQCLRRRFQCSYQKCLNKIEKTISHSLL